MSTKDTIAQRLGSFVCGMEYAKLPGEVVHRLKDLLLDQLGCQLLGSAVNWNQAVYRLVKDNKQGGPATIVNYGDKAPVDDAAFVNGTFGQGCELDDYYDQGGGHPGAASLPVALALAEKTAVGGKELIAAIAAGYEAGWRVGPSVVETIFGALRAGRSQE